LIVGVRRFFQLVTVTSL